MFPKEPHTSFVNERQDCIIPEMIVIVDIPDSKRDFGGKMKFVGKFEFDSWHLRVSSCVLRVLRACPPQGWLLLFLHAGVGNIFFFLKKKQHEKQEVDTKSSKENKTKAPADSRPGLS